MLLVAATGLFVISLAYVGSSHILGNRNKYENDVHRNTYTRQEKEENQKCGYESCHQPKDGMLNIHVVPHSHNDVGWLKTVDQYYDGSNSKVQVACVKHILDSVVRELLTDPDKRFIYAESAFFFMWWDEQTDFVKQQVKKLVNEGRLEFIGGAWSMNDEAAVHYQSVIDQFTWGLRRLNDTFGACSRPRIGWQIDPFGHSREMASMLAQMGYDGQFFGRIDYQDKNTRLDSRTMEFLWHGSGSLGQNSDLFSGVLFNVYHPPEGFCFDILCKDEPIIDDEHSSSYNVQRRVDQWVQYLWHVQRNYYKSGHLMITFGGDFHYQAAPMYFKNLDKLIK